MREIEGEKSSLRRLIFAFFLRFAVIFDIFVLQKELILALQNGLTIRDISKTPDGYKIIFSNDKFIVLENGKSSLITIGSNGNWFIDGEDTGKSSEGNDGIGVNNIVNIVWKNDLVTFKFSDNSVVSIPVNIELCDNTPIYPKKITRYVMI